MQTKPQFSANIYSFTTEILHEKLYISCSDKTAEFSHIYHKIFQNVVSWTFTYQPIQIAFTPSRHVGRVWFWILFIIL